MTTDDVRTVTFEQARKGYRVEDVDDFLLQVANEMERIEGERGRAMGEREPLARQIQQMAAERDAAIEAKQKAEQMLREATGQSEILREKAEQEAERERKVLAGLVEEVHRFKSTILNLYKQHIESLSALDMPIARTERALEVEASAAGGAEEYGERPMVDEAVLGRAEPEIPARSGTPAAFSGREETPAT